MKKLLIILLLSSTPLLADDDHCGYFKYCGGASPTSSKSLPSTGTSSSFNPSNISRVKGLGVETLLQAKNPVAFNVVTGTGKIGGALISPTVENSFFGNRSLEMDDVFFERRENKKRYKNKKIHLALGFNLYDKRDFAFDIGFSAKRNPDIKKINPGVGFSAKAWFLNFGAYIYKDDVKISSGSYFNPYTGQYRSFNAIDTYQESYTVKTFTVGTKIQNFSLDFGTIMTRYNFYPEDTVIHIYSAAYSYKNFLFNLAYRNEDSPNSEEVGNMIIYQRNKKDIYTGVQYLVNKHLVLGVGYNTFLLNEFSGTVTIFI